MSKYNQRGKATTQKFSAVKTSATPTGQTFEGAPGYARDVKSELFLLAASHFMGEDKFYESAKQGDNRVVTLMHQAAVADPWWAIGFVWWLRTELNMRTVALVCGLEGAKAIVESGLNQAAIPNASKGPARMLASAGIFRGDEPGEAMGYWFGKYGRRMPQSIRRGIGDGAQNVYNEYTALKYDTPSREFRFADVLELTHAPNSGDLRQSRLFDWLLDRRHGRRTDRPASNLLHMVRANEALRASDNPNDWLDTNRLREAGMTWEDALSAVGSKVPKKQLWEALIPTMGYMALLRNLRNFDEAGVSNEMAELVGKKLADPYQVARSRQLPFRFLSAYEAVPSLRWAWPLEQALGHSLSNIPSLDGNTLILVDTSSSMDMRLSLHGSRRRWDAASLFGIALALRNPQAEIVSFSNRTRQFRVNVSGSVLSEWKRWNREGFNLGGGTDTVGTLRQHLHPTHRRVIILTDEQASRDWYGRDTVDSLIPAGVTLHTINLAGYQMGYAPSGKDNRHVYGGLNDKMFHLLKMVEQGTGGHWPWERKEN